LKWSANGPVFVGGFGAYNSAQKSVNITNVGWPSGSTAQMTQNGTGFAPLAALSSLAPTLTIIDVGIVDWFLGTSVSTFQANLTTLVTAAKVSGDVILLAPNPSQPSVTCDGSTNPSQATQQLYINAIYAVAASQNVPVVDEYNSIGSWANANAVGGMEDCLHPNSVIYYDMAYRAAHFMTQAR
jgi:lysophospholipase L1-like esterase